MTGIELTRGYATPYKNNIYYTIHTNSWNITNTHTSFRRKKPPVFNIGDEVILTKNGYISGKNNSIYRIINVSYNQNKESHLYMLEDIHDINNVIYFAPEKSLSFYHKIDSAKLFEDIFEELL